MLFIVIHQVYELWFKELLHELDRVMQLLDSRRAAPRAAHAEADPDDPEGDGRAARHPRDDDAARVPQSFRERLEAASGFQSDQFRQIEFVLGVKTRARDRALRRRQPRARARSSGAIGEPTLWDAFLRYLAREGYAVPPAQLARDVDARRSSRRPRSSRSSSTSTAAIRRTPSSASGWSISTKAFRSGAIAT